MTPLAPDLSAFLQKHLPDERGASQHTIAAYAHAFTLLLRFAATRLKRQPSDIAIEDLDVSLIRAFLEHIEEGRANTVRSRNARLAAIKAFFRFLEPRRPACLEQAMMIRSLPVKRADVKLIDYLTKDEVRALLAAQTAERRLGCVIGRCFTWPMPQDCGRLNFSQFGWTISRGARSQTSGCLGRAVGSGCCRFGRRRKLPFGLGWPSVPTMSGRNCS